MFPAAADRTEGFAVDIDTADGLRPGHHAATDTPNPASLRLLDEIGAILARSNVGARCHRDIQLHALAVDPGHRPQRKTAGQILARLGDQVRLVRKVVDKFHKRRSRVGGPVFLQVALAESELRLRGQPQVAARLGDHLLVDRNRRIEVALGVLVINPLLEQLGRRGRRGLRVRRRGRRHDQDPEQNLQSSCSFHASQLAEAMLPLCYLHVLCLSDRRRAATVPASDLSPVRRLDKHFSTLPGSRRNPLTSRALARR